MLSTVALIAEPIPLFKCTNPKIHALVATANRKLFFCQRKLRRKYLKIISSSDASKTTEKRIVQIVFLSNGEINAKFSPKKRTSALSTAAITVNRTGKAERSFRHDVLFVFLISTFKIVVSKIQHLTRCGVPLKALRM